MLPSNALFIDERAQLKIIRCENSNIQAFHFSRTYLGTRATPPRGSVLWAQYGCGTSFLHFFVNMWSALNRAPVMKCSSTYDVKDKKLYLAELPGAKQAS